VEKNFKKKPFIEWKAYAYVRGVIKRVTQERKFTIGKTPDGEWLYETKKYKNIVFYADDGKTKFPIFDIGRETGGSVKKMFITLDQIPKEHVWKLYPQTYRGTPGVVLVSFEEPRFKQKEDLLRFEASFYGLEGNIMTVYVGRRDQYSKLFHFLYITIPDGMKLPEMKKKDRVSGLAQRNGSDWILMPKGEDSEGHVRRFEHKAYVDKKRYAPKREGPPDKPIIATKANKTSDKAE